MSYLAKRAYNALNNRVAVYNSVVDKTLSKEEICIASGIKSPETIRGICDILLLNEHIKSIKVYNKKIKRWIVKYTAVKHNPVRAKSYEQIFEEYEKIKSERFNVKAKGKWDDLISKNPNLRVIKGFNKEMQQGWKKKKNKSFFTGIASSFYIEA